MDHILSQLTPTGTASASSPKPAAHVGREAVAGYSGSDESTRFAGDCADRSLTVSIVTRRVLNAAGRLAVIPSSFPPDTAEPGARAETQAGMPPNHTRMTGVSAGRRFDPTFDPTGDSEKGR